MITVSRTINPYGRGFDAGLRVGEHANCREVPDCPFGVGSRDAKAWYAGYQDGADALAFEATHRTPNRRLP